MRRVASAPVCRAVHIAAVQAPRGIAALRFPALTVTVAPALSVRHFAATPLRRWGSQEEDDESHFDAASSLRRDASAAAQQQSADQLARSVLGPIRSRDAALLAKVVAHLTRAPCNSMITAKNVVVTHVENEEGVEEKQKSTTPMGVEAALAQAQNVDKDLVQVAYQKASDTSYCRIRSELSQFLDGSALAAEEEDIAAREAAELQELVTHEFRDVADAHFIDWRSKKIVLDVAKRHPVKLVINKFTAPEAAVKKMREMLDRIKLVSELAQPPVPHHHTGVQSSDRSLAVTLSPAPAKGAAKVKHPTEADWGRVLGQFNKKVQDSGRSGTYRKSDRLKAHATGSRDYRVDRYGRRIE